MNNKIIGKTFEILHLILRSKEPVNIKKLAEQSNCCKSTVSRIISDLIELNLIEKSSYYDVTSSLGAISIGHYAAENYSLVKLINPFIHKKSQEYNVNCALASIINSEVVYLYRSLADNPGLAIGMPFHSSLSESFIAITVFTKTIGVEETIKLFESRAENEPSCFSKEELPEIIQKLDKRGYIFHEGNANTWRICFPLEFHNKVYGLSFYSDHKENYNFSILIMNLSMMILEIKRILTQNHSNLIP